MGKDSESLFQFVREREKNIVAFGHAAGIQKLLMFFLKLEALCGDERIFEALLCVRAR